ncbi:unnamed protein product (macronuclear) [Paramecium tetraurelia]|uniref:Uncharacterized protein n=1 Tax=Paramecium tetraurelia TaxID=5888 RepID=A0BR17_PARTE|nr:uncharacterized protein GSPATT00031213001 [Paramecium tetraurelia]CAK60984.1 unnamed protein product [Paramecium tetraurelia]|eukprot:XP_001428382.1 hypothetical protein (macronuclear) [Paramecium tetraurelia strain d4-2]
MNAKTCTRETTKQFLPLFNDIDLFHLVGMFLDILQLHYTYQQIINNKISSFNQQFQDIMNSWNLIRNTIGLFGSAVHEGQTIIGTELAPRVLRKGGLISALYNLG